MAGRAIKVGVLALQGAFSKHLEMLNSLGVHAIEVRKSEELQQCHGLIIPGGESTTIMRQINFIKLAVDLEEFAKQKPIFGTCAGLILMSKKIVADPMTPFGFLDIEVERNAFGRQADSFQMDVDMQLEGKTQKKFPAVFIRAPKIKACTTKVEILSEYAGEPILVKQGCHLGSTFHPELTNNSSIHEFFIKIISQI
jgi:pyridoxal 5'-phosphate synthase pdxT subunit